MRTLMVLSAALGLFAAPAAPQTWTVDDPVLRRIWEVGMGDSQLERIAQPLLDSIGPRLSGSQAHTDAHQWAAGLLRSWGIDAEVDEFGPAPDPGWERGLTHVDLIEPRLRTLEATLFARSRGTDGPVEGVVAVVPEYARFSEYAEWLGTVRGKFVAVSPLQPTCRPDAQYAEFGSPGAVARVSAARHEANLSFFGRMPPLPSTFDELATAGAAGILRSEWTGEIGVASVTSNASAIPLLGLSCEDYGLLYRLAVNGQGPVIRVDAEAHVTTEVPVVNTLAELRGRQLPGEYVMLSAHMDSYDAASGATDNGSGVVTMLEAMRILREAYPAPRRTIMLGLWGSEEDGLAGSRRFVESHADVVENLQILLNQDSGTGRVAEIFGEGFLRVGPHFADWLGRIPPEIGGQVKLTPGASNLGSDYGVFVNAGAPAVELMATSWRYWETTHHTNRDTYDKLVFEDLRSNAVLVAMLAYLASEDPARVGRERAIAGATNTFTATTELTDDRPLASDGAGPYGHGAQGVASRVGGGLTLCTRSTACAVRAFPTAVPQAPGSGGERAFVLDLTRPVAGFGAPPRGVVRSEPATIQATSISSAMADVPIDSTVVADGTGIRFFMDGRPHILQFGWYVFPERIAGFGTTMAMVTRSSPTAWVLRAAPDSRGRLWDIGDPERPVDLGLYEFSFEVTFRTGEGDPR